MRAIDMSLEQNVKHRTCFTNLKFFRMLPSSLAHEHPRPRLQLQLLRRSLHPYHLGLHVTVQVQHGLVVLHSHSEAVPGVRHGRHAEPGCLFGLPGADLAVEQNDVLLRSLNGRQLDAQVHDLLRRVGDGEDDAAVIGGGLQAEDEGEVPVEGVGEVGTCQLARGGLWPEQVGGAVVRAIHLQDLLWRRIADQLQQRHTAVFWKTQTGSQSGV